MGNLIKWTGSKRHLARQIITSFPSSFDTYYEPFLGSGSVLLSLKPPKAIASDTDKNLIALWNEFKHDGLNLIERYTTHRRKFIEDSNYFYQARDKFNKAPSPDLFCFLLRTCHNGLVRYSAGGRFNSSVHFTRKGIVPDKLAEIWRNARQTLNRTEFHNCDYREITRNARKGDFVFFDPQYPEVKPNSMYGSAFDPKTFFDELRELNAREVKWALTYGSTTTTQVPPADVYRVRLALKGVKSSFSALKQKGVVKIREMLYLNYSTREQKTLF